MRETIPLYRTNPINLLQHRIAQHNLGLKHLLISLHSRHHHKILKQPQGRRRHLHHFPRHTRNRTINRRRRVVPKILTPAPGEHPRYRRVNARHIKHLLPDAGILFLSVDG